MGLKSQPKIICLSLLLIFGTQTSQATCRSLPETTMNERHKQWISHHGRVYKDVAEKEARCNIFKGNIEKIDSFNKDSNKSNKLGVNQFADLTDGFKQLNRLESRVRSSDFTSLKYENVSDVPATLDRRKKGAVTAVKNQGYKCGCCWAFSTVAAMKGINQLTTNKLVSLSEQELVDCDTFGGNQGCKNVYPSEAFKFSLENKGLPTEENYPRLLDSNTFQLIVRVYCLKLLPNNMSLSKF